MNDRGPIVVPLDGSELSEGSLPYAVRLADALRSHLVLVTVWGPADPGLGETSVALEVNRTAPEFYIAYLHSVREKFGMADRARTVVRSGDPAEEILKVAADTAARALVLSTHGRSGIARWLHGSTAGRLLRASPAPVVAVGPQAKAAATPAKLERIMVPLDGSPLAEQALPVARDLASALGARVSLVRVVQYATVLYPHMAPVLYVPQIDDALTESATAYLAAQQSKLNDVPGDSSVLRGTTADSLIDFVEMEHIDLVVMTTHARAGLERSLLGSTADRMLACKAPVLLVRPGASAP